MNPSPPESESVEVKPTARLRHRVLELRHRLVDTTTEYRRAVARHESTRVVQLLRTRSDLMRQLLESQCELLLAIRSETAETLDTDELTSSGSRTPSG